MAKQKYFLDTLILEYIHLFFKLTPKGFYRGMRHDVN
jgi:hypothetical protein